MSGRRKQQRCISDHFTGIALGASVGEPVVAADVLLTVLEHENGGLVHLGNEGGGSWL